VLVIIWISPPAKTFSGISSSSASFMAIPREVVKIFESIEQSEGDGARVRRSIGRPELTRLDPFILLDEFKVGKPAGFPDHPHRGFETVTYMLDGQVKHEDFAGHSGVIGPGDLQWMTAGRGIMHCEMPVSEVPCTGLQLWVNLKKSRQDDPTCLSGTS
jgi:redox-sensitive bicupin YhaK (pirin superfamily)